MKKSRRPRTLAGVITRRVVVEEDTLARPGARIAVSDCRAWVIAKLSVVVFSLADPDFLRSLL